MAPRPQWRSVIDNEWQHNAITVHFVWYLCHPYLGLFGSKLSKFSISFEMERTVLMVADTSL